MSVIEFCLPFSVAILGLAYPVLLQVISRLDDKYGYDFVSFLKKEKEFQWFTLLLKSNISFNVLYVILKVTTSYIIKPYHELFLFEIKLLILVSLVVLIIAFFSLLKQIFRYYSTNELIEYIINTRKKELINNELNYLSLIRGMSISSIKHQDSNLSTNLANFYYDLFFNYRKKINTDMITYPELYYDQIYSLANEFIQYTENKATVLEHYIFSGILITGELEYHKLSDRSYTYLWWLVRLSVKNKKDDLVLDFWSNSFQYYRSFERETMHYSNYYNEELSKHDLEIREKEKHRFLEFHYALGGLILYKKRYQCLTRIFAYTQSEPPDYVLFPSSTSEVYSWFLEFQDDYRSPIDFINMRYAFPELDGLSADRTIRYWISRYIILHFLILYKRHKYYITQEFNSIPHLPESISEQKYWLEFVDPFRSLLNSVLEDKILLRALKLEFITDEWCSESKKMTPFEIIQKLKQQLQESINFKEISQEIDSDKRQEFNDFNRTIINETITEYSGVVNKKLIEENYNHWSNAGFIAIFDKSAFCTDQGVHYANTTSFLGNQFSTMFKLAFSDILFQKKEKTLMLPETDLLRGLENFKLDKDKHLVIAFDLSYLLDNWGSNGVIITSENKYNYNGLDIYNFNVCNHLLVGRSMFIIDKINLPSVLFKHLDNETVAKYKLELIDESIKLYGNVIDLYKEPEIRKEQSATNPDKDLNKFVLAYLGIYTEFRLKQNIKLVQLKQYIDYKEKGLPNSLSDIEPF